MDELQWDKFAPEYYEIQEESQQNIVRDVKRVLLSEKIIPTKDFADVAGGAGRYLTIANDTKNYELIDFSREMLRFAKMKTDRLGLNNVTFIKQSFHSFLEDTKTYDVIFMAENPSFDKPDMIENLLEKATENIVIIRIVENTDDLFTPLESRFSLNDKDLNTLPEFMEQLEKYLNQHEIFHKKIEFTYTLKEEITFSFIKEYYKEYMDNISFVSYLENLFGHSQVLMSTTRISYRMIVCPTNLK